MYYREQPEPWYQGEEVRMYSSRIVRKARKAHTCNVCREQIKPGSSYMREEYLFDNKWITEKTCEPCRFEQLPY